MRYKRPAACVPADPDVVPDEVLTSDYVVVGVGTSGAALVWGLTNPRGSCKRVPEVLAIEAGADRNSDPDVLGTEEPYALASDQSYWLSYPANMAEFLNADLLMALYQMGKAWGGSSAVNYLLHVRGTPSLYDAWATFGDRWGYDALLPYMKALETYTSLGTGIVNADQRGTAGPLFITQLALELEESDAFSTAMSVGGGIAWSPDYNDATEGTLVVGTLEQYVTPATPAERSWSGSAFLGPSVVKRKDNGDGVGANGRPLRIESNAYAYKLLIDDSPTIPRVYGVRYIQNGRIIDAIARRKVIVSAGAIESPLLLQRSGIGPRALLEGVDIPVVLENDNVGANMQNHYGCQAAIPAPDGGTTFELPAPAFSDLRGDNVGAGSGVREFQLLPIPLGEAVVFYAWNLRPAKNGTVEVQSNVFPSNPLVTFNYWKAEDDVERAVKALKVIANVSLAYTGLMPTTPDAALYPVGEYPGGAAAGDEDLEAYVRTVAVFTNHTSGTCRMAASAEDGVVDGDLNVFGVTGLSVCDNSVAPEIEDGNTAYTAYLIGLIKAVIEGGSVAV